MKIDKQIRQWAQMVNESEDYGKSDIKNYYLDDIDVSPDTKHGYYVTIKDVLRSLTNIMDKDVRMFFEVQVEVRHEEGGTPGDVGDWVTEYVEDAKYEKGLIVLRLTDQKSKGINAVQLMTVPLNEKRDWDDIELVTQNGRRFYHVDMLKRPSGIKLRLFLDYDWNGGDDVNPRVKNGKVNEAEESPITMLFRTRPNVDDNAGKITFTSIDEMKNFIEAVGGDYSKEVADGFTQGKLMSIDLKQPIQQLTIQQQKKS